MPAAAPDINLVAFNTHGQGISASDGTEPVSRSSCGSSHSNFRPSKDDPAEAVSRFPSIYKGAQWWVSPKERNDTRANAFIQKS